MARVFRMLLLMISNRMDEVLVAYERATPCIDQVLVRRTLGTIALARRIAGTL